METESSVVVVEAPSTADYHHWPNSGLGEQPSLPYEIDKSDSWKERIHFMMSRLRDRATGFKACLLLKQKKRLLSCLEVILLSSVILITWIIFTTPTIVFALSSATDTNKESSISGEQNATLNTSASLCSESQRVKYEGEICSKEFAQWQLCFLGPQDTSEIYLPAFDDQQETEATAHQLLSYFHILGPSSECVAAFQPFLCLELFGLCDSRNQLHQVTRTDCVRLTTDTCRKELNAAREFLDLPSCDTFEDRDFETQCLEDIIAVDASPTPSDGQTLDAKQNVTCADGFYLSNSSVCRPLCSNWVESSDGHVFQNVQIACAIIGLVSSMVFITVALTCYRSEILIFPKCFIFYFCITLAFIYLITLIGVLNKEELFCSSDDFIESYFNETPFCTISGITYIYGVLQSGCWTLILTLVIFWGIYFPFHYQRFQASGQLKHFHITAVVLAVALPAIPALTLLRDGYHISQFSFCTGQSLNTIFYGFVLPSSILSGVVTTLMILILWNILKQFAIKTLSKGLKKAHEMGKAEAKILFLTLVYILISSLSLVTITHAVVMREREIQIISDYFWCQSTGVHQGKQCDEGIQSTPLDTLLEVAIILEGLIPLCALIFVAKCTCNYNCLSTS